MNEEPVNEEPVNGGPVGEGPGSGGSSAGELLGGESAAGSGDPWVAALAAWLGGPAAWSRAADFARRAPFSYRELTSPEQAAADLVVLDELDGAAPGIAGDDPRPGGSTVGASGGGGSRGGGSRDGGETWPGGGPGDPYRFALAPEAASSAGPERSAPAHGGPARGAGDRVGFRLRRYGRQAEELSSLLPLVESFGLVVVEAVPHRIDPAGRRPSAHIEDVGVRFSSELHAGRFDLASDGTRLLAALEASVSGRADVDALNALVLGAGLDWHEVALLRAYRRYRRQTGAAVSDTLDQALVAWPEVTSRLIGYARARFAAGGRGEDSAETGGAAVGAEPARQAVLDAIGEVSGLEADQELRAYLALIDATTRTNWAIRGPSGEPRPTVVVKLDGARVPDLAPPIPRVETWVHAPHVEGVHLRNGLIARGGIRWSERPEDFRTEILDLAEAQTKKNAIIVPTGAKGGFVARSPWSRSGAGRSAPPSEAQVEAAYRTFIDALFDVTDNIVDGVVLPPEGVAVHDGEDPYLVVAADKGTATFSDVANEISARRRFWLGDAFASGGSNGYDHKAMGITARGAWVAVRRHFHELGVDVGREPVRVCGVGDMSGDVFGNGMLQSSAIQLVAAFDHRHVFLDPDPDPARSFRERRRLFELSRSSWDDYDRRLISPGGGIWSRNAKVIPLTTDARRALGVESAELSPPEVISAILRAPVDLLFFGGIGTYVKGPGEADSEVGDLANDGVRVSADDVRARVIAEGANLAVTQRGRIRYSRRGGRINADFIDNAAGVATSDREVNLKILLNLAVDDERISSAQRSELLVAATDDVAQAVLVQVDRSVAALNRAVPASAVELDAHEALLRRLETEGLADRAVDHLPDPEEFAVRRRAGAGLIRPELAVLLASAKSDLVAQIEASQLVRDGTLAGAVTEYFPPSFRVLGADLPARHRLAPQLAATTLAGELIDEMGIAWAHETATELGRPVTEVAAAFWAARGVLGADPLWRAIEGAAGGVPAETEAWEQGRVASAVANLARRYLALHDHLDPRTLVAVDRSVAEALEATWAPTDRADRAGGAAGEDTGSAAGGAPGAGDGSAAGGAPGAAGGLLDGRHAGMDPELDQRIAALSGATYVADVARIAAETGLGHVEVIRAFVALDVAVAPDLIVRLEAVRPQSRWEAWQARALIDDLVAWRARAVRAALGSRPARALPPPPPGALAQPEAAVAAWLSEHRMALSRVDGLVRAFDSERPDALSVAGLLARVLAATV